MIYISGPAERTPSLANVLGGGEAGGRLRWRKDQLAYKPTVEQPDMYVSYVLAG